MLDEDPQKAFFVSVLELVCEKAKTLGNHCTLVPVDVDMYQQRQLQSLDKDILDVMWTVTSIERERDYLPIRIPLTKGLIGYRIAVVNQYSKEKLSKITPLEALKKLHYVQGHDWPDSTILQSNGFNVSTTTWNTALFRSLGSEHYDVLLRGVLEVTSEVELYSHSNIEIDQQLAFYYSSAIYFFVAKKRSDLAQLIESSCVASQR